MKQLGILQIPPGWDSGPLQFPSISSSLRDNSSVPSYTPGSRGTASVNRCAREHNTLTRPGLEPRPLERESSVLNIKPSVSRLHWP